MNTQENNKLIAEFMGLIESSIDKKYWTEKTKEGIGKGELVELKYHKSWDWLMPVVEKIKNIAVEDENIEVFYEVLNHIPDRHETYKAVVEFINQYNKTK